MRERSTSPLDRYFSSERTRREISPESELPFHKEEAILNRVEGEGAQFIPLFLFLSRLAAEHHKNGVSIETLAQQGHGR